MKKYLILLLTFWGIQNQLIAQNSYTVYDEIVFYDGYAATVSEPVPTGFTRINNATYTTKLSADLIANLADSKLNLEVKIGALCDNYDRLGHVYLAFVEKGATFYMQSEVERIEIARIITPFMNKNINPTEVPYHFQIDNVSEIFSDSAILAEFDIWLEFEVFGVPYAAQTQVSGCSGRIDVFKGTLTFNVSEATETYSEPNFLLPLSCRVDLNNYNATDVPGETTRIIEFTLDEPVENAVLYLITSNHGANAGGEEYERRWHNLYLNNELIHTYIPGGKSCEPWRQYNTQGNGIYSLNPRTTRQWLDFNNWCPGDKIPNREVILGNLPAGTHTIKLDVPDAVFVNNEGYFPISMYIQNRKSGQVFCADPNEFVVAEQNGTTVKVAWNENGTADQWEVLYGRRYTYTQETFVDVDNGIPEFEVNNLQHGWFYQFYTRAKCSADFNSNWVGPISTNMLLSTNENSLVKFNLYPNPTSNRVQIESPWSVKSISVFNQEGKLVFKTNNDYFNLESYPKGVYSVFVQFTNGETETSKVIKR